MSLLTRVYFNLIKYYSIPLKKTRSGQIYNVFFWRDNGECFKLPCYFKVVDHWDKDIVIYFSPLPMSWIGNKFLTDLIIDPIKIKNKPLDKLIEHPNVLFIASKAEYNKSWSLIKPTEEELKKVDNRHRGMYTSDKMTVEEIVDFLGI